MNRVNFMKNDPVKITQRYNRWYYGTLYSLVTTALILVCINGYQYYQLTQLKEQTIHAQKSAQELDRQAAVQDKLHQEKQALQAHLTKLHNLAHSPDMPAEYLTFLSTIIPDTVRLTTIERSATHTLLLAGLTQSVPDLTQFIESLNQDGFNYGIHLNSLQPSHHEENQMIMKFSLVGTLKK